MRVAWSQLSERAVERLRRGHEQRGLGTDTFFLPQDRPKRIAKALVIAVLAGAGSLFAMWQVAREGLHDRASVVAVCVCGLIALQALTWTPTLLAELARRRRSAIKPFFLATPIEVLLVDLDGEPVKGAALDDATDFKKVNQADGSGVEYRFIFPGSIISATVPNRECAKLDLVLARARELRGDGDARSELQESIGLLPKGAPDHTSSAWDQLRRPFTELWLVIGGLDALAAVLAILTAEILK